MSPPADEHLAPEGFPALNESFYRSEPHAYLGQRLTNLLLVAGKPEELIDLMDSGITFGEASVGRRPDSPERDQEEDDKNGRAFVALEAELLLHHASETLLRLFFAHSGLLPCPWLEMSRLRGFSKFKALVEATFLTKDPLDRTADVAQVFFPSADRRLIDPDISAETWDGNLETIDGLLTHFADHFHSRAHLYNAGKHGLAVLPGEHAISMGLPDLSIDADGMALQYLEKKAGKWQRTIAWVDPEVLIAYIWLAIDLIEQLWAVGRARYTDKKVHKLKIYSPELLGELSSVPARKAGGAFTVNKVSFELTCHSPDPVGEL
jgi:hypothetical protein